MGNLDLKVDEAAAADMAAQSEASPVSPIPQVRKPNVNPDTELHLESEGDTLEEDDLEIVAEPLPVFDTHGSRHLG
jgi:hypothetical protein